MLFQDARQKLAAEDVAAAVALFLKAIAGAGKDAERVFERFADEVVAGHKAAEVYRALPDAEAERGFRLLADSLDDESYLLEAEDVARLEALLTAHRARRPKDVWLAFYDGVLLNRRKEYDRAEGRLADAMARAPDDDTRDRFRWARVDNLADAGRFGEAYTKIGPVRETFSQLAFRLGGPDDVSALSKLVWLHGKVAPTDPALPLWRGTVAFRRKDYETAVVELRTFLADNEARYDWPGQDHLVRSLIRLKRVPEARAALPPADARRYLNRILVVVVAAASGDVAATEKELAAFLADRPGAVAEVYADPDLSAILRTEPFRKLLEKYPPPKGGPAAKK